MEGEAGQQRDEAFPVRYPGLPLQIWHITLKRPQAYVHIGNENALEERKEDEESGIEKKRKIKLHLLHDSSKLLKISY